MVDSRSGESHLGELQHKMSKKIAQLTKVIYHLNTRNEDADVTIKSLTAQHEQEVNLVLEDAANKIRRFKDELEKRSGNQVTKSALEEMEDRHEKEKKRCLDELASVRLKATAREEHAAAEFKSRIKAMQRELNEAKQTFQNSVAKMEAKGGELAGERETQIRAEYEKQLEDLRSAKQIAVSEAAVAAAAAEASVEAEQEATLALESLRVNHAKVLDQNNAAHESALKTLEEELVSARSRALAGVRDAATADLVDAEEKFAKRAEALRAELERCRSNEDRLKKELENSTASLEASASEIAALRESCAQEKRERELAQQNATSSQEQVAVLKRSLREQQSSAAAIAAKLEADVAAASAQGGALSEKLAAAELKIREKGESITTMTSKNLALVESVQIKDKEILALEERSSKLQGALERAESLQSESHSAAAQRTKELEARLLAAEESTRDLERKIVENEQGHKIKADETEKMHKAALDAEREAGMSRLEKLESELRSEINTALAQYETAEQSAAERFDAMAKAHADEIENLDKTRGEKLSGLEHRIEHITRERDESIKEAALSKAGFESEQANSKRLEENIRRITEERNALSEKVELLDKSLIQGKVESLELQRSCENELIRQAKESDAKLAETIIEWREKLETEIASHNKDKSATVQDMEQKLRRATQELEKHGAQRYAALSEDLNETRSALVAARKQCDELVASHHDEIERSKDLHGRELAGLHARGETALKEAAQAAASELEAACISIRANEREERDALRRELIGAKLTELAALRDEMAKAHSANMEKLEKRGEQAMQAALVAQARKLEDESSRRAEETAGFHALALRKLNTRIGTLQENLQSAQECTVQLEKQMAVLKDSHSADLNRLDAQRQADAENHRTQIAQTRIEHQRQLSEQQASASQDKQKMKTKHEGERAGLQEQITDQRKAIQYWEHRYEHREPREEDVKKINKLTKKLSSAEESARKALQDMDFYKRELVNRETSYNKVFGSNLNVGVIQVVPDGNGTEEQISQIARDKERRKKEKKEKKEKKRKKKEKELEQLQSSKPLEFPPLGNPADSENNVAEHFHNNKTNHGGSFNGNSARPTNEFGPENDEEDSQETRSVVLERPKRHFATNAPPSLARRLTLE